jgi:hypothetical protein
LHGGFSGYRKKLLKNVKKKKGVKNRKSGKEGARGLPKKETRSGQLRSKNSKKNEKKVRTLAASSEKCFVLKMLRKKFLYRKTY